MRKREITAMRFERSRALEKYREAKAKYGENHSITKHLKKQYDTVDEKYLHTF